MTSFAERVARQFRPNAAESAFLTSLEASLARLHRGDLIARDGDPSHHAFVLRHGWAMSYTRFPDGSFQVRRLHFPGDLLAMPSLAMRHYAEDIEALSDCEIAMFPKSVLAEVFRLPRLAAILYMFAQAERVTLGDRLASLGHNRGKARIAFLLIDILRRLRSVDSSIACSFDMHLTREQVAHVTGMTPVHASRMWSELIATGLIGCVGHHVTILAEDQLAQIAHYFDRDTDFDLDWLRIVEATNR
ncbi:MAG TPA: Crp/Fnr family transcriptional regulator [Sphingomicrobium sp.]|nr:Crp/Fnr family transcriptional regulator [Sphingomicrobium sp.]